MTMQIVGPASLFDAKISYKDSGFSQIKGNYTEGWVMLPPNKFGSFSSVERRNKNRGVPLTFDTIKLKQASPVRKQSEKDMDLSSKFSHLWKQVEWIDQDWIGYDPGQMLLVLATCVFDFRNAKLFPFLYETEGGCGGSPPWDNIGSLYTALHYFNKGRSKKAIEALMVESYMIQTGKVKPCNGHLIQAAHFVQTGIDIGRVKSLFTDPGFTGMDEETKYRLLEQLAGTDPLPQELLDNSVLIAPEDKILGAIVSELRKEGMIMTELDVRMKIISLKKIDSLVKGEQMGRVLIELEQEKKLAKTSGMAKLAGLAKDHPKMAVVLGDLWSTAQNYYSMRKNRSDITGFSYAGRIRVFDTAEVEKVLTSRNFNLKDEVTAGLASSHEYFLATKQNQAREKTLWCMSQMSKGIDYVLGNPIPGIGPDDGRIIWKVKQLPKDTYCFIITDDAQLIMVCKMINHGIIQITKRKYFEYCRRPDRSGVELYSYLANKQIKVKELKSLLGWRGKQKYVVLYDFSNINRSIENIGGRKGGYLSRKTAKTKDWVDMPFDNFRLLSDFSTRP
jgi:hypothetical protein